MRLSLALLAACAFGLAAESFPPAEVAILGDIDYAQKSAEMECSGKPQYCALVFNGKSGDVVEVTVSGGERKPFVAFADGSLKELARGSGVASFTLPEVAEGLATYYIIFRDPENKPGRFTIELKKK
ncbi:MAG TPA: hypothetical protein VES20_20715 [Bryobacteraceae bacterium]|nr:hypothetical protein [Bryobacteraceae bacterium]